MAFPHTMLILETISSELFSTKSGLISVFAPYNYYYYYYYLLYTTIISLVFAQNYHQTIVDTESAFEASLSMLHENYEAKIAFSQQHNAFLFTGRHLDGGDIRLLRVKFYYVTFWFPSHLPQSRDRFGTIRRGCLWLNEVNWADAIMQQNLFKKHNASFFFTLGIFLIIINESFSFKNLKLFQAMAELYPFKWIPFDRNLTLPLAGTVNSDI